MQPRAVILLSGGMDSAVTLAVAERQGFACYALSFDYGQRHRYELDAAKHVAASIGVQEHKILTLDLRAFGGSALTADIDVPRNLSTIHPEPSTPIPVTYVPGRNIIFLSVALAYAETINSGNLFIGVNAIDYSGYPDCRPEFIAAFERMANLGTRRGAEATGRPIRVHTPLIELTKADIVWRGMELGVDFALTHTCYDPDPATGAPCRECDACRLRAKGFTEAGVSDPALA